MQNQEIESARKLLEKFSRLPLRHKGKELIVNVKITGFPKGIYPTTAVMLGLKKGETLQVSCDLPDLGRKGWRLYASGKLADWLEEVPKDSMHRVRVKLIAAEWADDIYHRHPWLPMPEDQLVTGLQLLEVLGTAS